MNRITKIMIKVRPLVISICILATGCVTTNNFKSLPLESTDFELPYEKLTEKYTEIPIYEKKFRGFSPNTPLAEDLVSVWGEPDAKKTDWTYFPLLGGTLAATGIIFKTSPVPLLVVGGFVLLIRPVPPETYIWQKGNYCIETITDKTFPNYKKRVIYWNWTDIHVTEKISKGCKQVQQQRAQNK